jgi:hypothetical protein
MGSTSFGKFDPATPTGPAMPHANDFNRASPACVRVVVAPS